MISAAMEAFSVDYALVGGGLQNALLALSLLAKRPDASVLLIERDTIGGNHVWCFHEHDVPASLKDVVAPLVSRSWPDHSVSFPRLERTLSQRYSAVHCRTLRHVLSASVAAAPNTRLLQATAVEVGAREVRLADGRRIAARVVVDARGPRPMERDAVGYQKFLGLELEADHDLEAPVLMDARVPQTDGMRFFYLLPLDPGRLLIEDTYFSDTPRLDRRAARASIAEYAARHGVRVQRSLREEAGVLPLPGRAPRQAVGPEGPLRGGYDGGWFHPTTGYSFPLALRLAECVALTAPERLHGALRELCRRHAKQARFAALLNRLLFRACDAPNRRNVLERFYRLPESTISRFYSLQTTAADRLRIVCGRPPEGLSLARAAAEGLPA